MYKPAKLAGDTIAVPQMLFSRLSSPAADDGFFKVALYVLANGQGDARTIAAELRLPQNRVELALTFWEGAGLLEQDAPPLPAAVAAEAPKRRRLTTREVVQAGEADPTLAILLDELQRVFGKVVGESDLNIFVTLYVVDGYPADLILMAASETAQRGISRAKYVEQVLKTWRQNGINDCAAADRHLKKMGEWETQQKQVANLMGLVWDPFTQAEKRKITVWFEEYGFDSEMIEMARLTAGDKQNDVRYLSGILKKWYGKGYHTPRDIRQGEEGMNLRVVGQTPPPAGEDRMAQVGAYVPLKKRGNSQ